MIAIAGACNGSDTEVSCCIVFTAVYTSEAMLTEAARCDLQHATSKHFADMRAIPNAISIGLAGCKTAPCVYRATWQDGAAVSIPVPMTHRLGLGQSIPSRRQGNSGLGL